MGNNELFFLNWNDHGSTFCDVLASLLRNGNDKYTDVTLSCEGRFYQVHKLVLSTCSEYFERVFENTPCKHPVIVLSDVKCHVLESILSYMYKGVVSVAHRDLSRLIKVAELLQIKGLKLLKEPQASSESGSCKLSNKCRLSPRSSSDSPSPKSRRQRESDNYQPISSQSRNNDSHELSGSEDRDNRVREDRLFDLPQKSLRSAVTASVDETLVQGEILDNDNEADILESDYAGLGDHSGDGSQGACGLMIPRFDDAKDVVREPSPVTPPDPVVEVVAGPSGIRGWLDGGVITRRMSRGEGFARGDSQDMSSSVDFPAPDSGQLPQMNQVLGQEILRGRNVIRKGKSGAIARKYSCFCCDYVAKRRRDLENHIRKHTGERPFTCSICNRSFRQQSALHSHLRTHSGEKPYTCAYCPSSFTHRSNVKYHERSKHTGEKPYECPYCSKRFPQQSILKSHKRVHHRGGKP